MSSSLVFSVKLTLLRWLSTVVLVCVGLVNAATAHEVLPSVADMERQNDRLVFDLRVNLESFLAEIDLAEVTDTNDTDASDTYDTLRALEPAALEEAFRAFWPQMAAGIDLQVDGARLDTQLDAVSAGEVGNTELVRPSTFRFSAALPADAAMVQVGWAPEFGALVLRQNGVDAPYDGFLNAGALTPQIALDGGDAPSGWQSFLRYIPVGFDHILPKGLDHILFVLGLFFLSVRMRPLVMQVSLFTLAHTITLALAALGYVNVPGNIVEPLIAASIVFIAVENIWAREISRWRPFVIFGFGLLHGMGFASVLAEFGLPDQTFVPALIGFNVGVEIGQLAVIAVMFLCVAVALRVDRGENVVRPGLILYAGLIGLAVLLSVLNPGVLETALENPTWVFAAPLAGVFALCAASIQFSDKVDSYRRFVAIPCSVAIAAVGLYWVAERVLPQLA